MKPVVFELTEPYENFMRNPRPSDTLGVCKTCFAFTEGHEQCYRCSQSPSRLDACSPITYSIHTEQMHNSLSQYKRSFDVAARKRTQLEVAAVLYRFLDQHEKCLARSAQTEGFDVVTIVPSGSHESKTTHPLERLVGAVVPATRDRYRPLLERTDVEVPPRTFSTSKYEAIERLDGKSVLLVDDTWTTGSSAQSAASALKDSGAVTVGAVVIGRHVHRTFADHGRRLGQLPSIFDWGTCAHH